MTTDDNKPKPPKDDDKDKPPIIHSGGPGEQLPPPQPGIPPDQNPKGDYEEPDE
jgi:hypothetical protein